MTRLAIVEYTILEAVLRQRSYPKRTEWDPSDRPRTRTRHATPEAQTERELVAVMLVVLERTFAKRPTNPSRPMPLRLGGILQSVYDRGL